MKFIKPYYEIRTDLTRVAEMLMSIEDAGRTCYKSEDKITPDSAPGFIKGIISRGHESVIEHETLSVRFVCDRGVSHELVRHRLCSFSQESTRYCNYSKDKFGNELTFIMPEWVPYTEEQLKDLIDEHYYEDDPPIVWGMAMMQAEVYYLTLLQLGWSPQQARSVLPNSLKTEIVMTANFREWREIFRQRTAPGAHPQMRELMVPLLAELKEKIPIIFDDI